ncbi:hypothetical protein A2V80_02035 [Candidatus Woesebacteria bacterium RBG_16_39_8b]|uniref:Uncharacterized protein n=1 Tax=Candidatus Woesebacteria bacterium RBG_16_39_8b TaxID=1802482 RepID=A0A1F7XGR0_9BACT|nr:MAG: hypothetical protein A2V80_02035 [Candidatus Woesebacteria bacterium RBG_16_39_8b]
MNERKIERSRIKKARDRVSDVLLSSAEGAGLAGKPIVEQELISTQVDFQLQAENRDKNKAK